MSNQADGPRRVALYESEGASTLPGRAEMLQTLLEGGVAVSRVRTPPAADSTTLALAWLQPGETADQEIASDQKNIEGLEPSAVLDLVNQQVDREEKFWKPWFPVIDHDRCTDCMQCLSFCLFDVYGVDSGTGGIQVRNEQNCKTDCPACSRVCPEVAILFPKYSQGPINGDTVREQDLEREKMKVDISALLGGDIYATLKTRSFKAKERFSKERDDKKALQERQRCLTELKTQMDIPDEVLTSLPSLQEIRQKAEEARRKAEDALRPQDLEQSTELES